MTGRVRPRPESIPENADPMTTGKRAEAHDPEQDDFLRLHGRDMAHPARRRPARTGTSARFRSPANSAMGTDCHRTPPTLSSWPAPWYWATNVLTYPAVAMKRLRMA